MLTAKQFNEVKKWLRKDNSNSIEISLHADETMFFKNKIWFYNSKIMTGKSVYLDDGFFIPDLYLLGEDAERKRY